MAKIVRCAVSVALALIGVGCAQASESGLHAWCNTFIEAGREKVQCHVRSRDGNDLRGATVRSASGRELPAVLDRYSSAKYTSAWYFLVQQSNVSSNQLAKMSKAVRGLLSFKGNHTFAVATYTDNLEQRSDFSPYDGRIDKILLDIQASPPSARPAALYKSARAAIYQLGNITADRKSLVLLSDGTNDDVTVTEKDVIEFARKNGVIIYTLFFGDKKGRPQALSRLADQTNGMDRDFSDDSANDFPQFASRFSQMLENGLVLTLDGRELPQNDELTISAGFRDKSLISEAAPVAVHRLTEDTIINRARRLFLDNSVAMIAALVIVMGLLLIIESLRRKKQKEYSFAVPFPPQNTGPRNGFDDPKRNQASEANANASEISISEPISEPAETSNRGAEFRRKVYGWLQLLDAESTRIPISAAALRIGRHEDNDLCIPNKSVHRHHALLHRTSAGEFIIRDLGTKNGVIVNGRRCAERRLQPNDLIELGEVRLRFFLNGEGGAGHPPPAGA